MAGPPNNNELFTDLTEALATAFPMVCVAVIVKDEDSPNHLVGDPEAANLLMALDCVQATLADEVPRTETPKPGTALAAAAFIAVEPLSLPEQQSLATVIVFVGKHLKDCERAVALVHALATETANELMILKRAPFLAAAFAEIECGVTIADPSLEDTPLIYANAAFERMTGYPKAELLGRNCRFLQGDLRDQPGLRKIRNALARGTDCTAVVTNFRKNGESFENRLKLRAIYTNGTISHIIGIQLDVSRERSALESLARQTRRYESMINTQSDYIWIMNAQGELIDIPEKWLELSGLSSSQGPIDLATIRSALTPEAAEAFRQGWVEALKNMTPFEVIYQLPAQSRSSRWFLDRIAPVLDDENNLIEWVVASQDITELKRAEKEIERIAYEDRLTGLLSSEGFALRLDERLKSTTLHPVSPVVVINIKALREINNAQGYDAGDEVLREVARRLTAEVGDSGLVARTGGDEFAVLAPLLKNQITLRQLRAGMAAVFDVPFIVNSFTFYVEASFGYARIYSSAGDARKLMTDAALAMHQSQRDPARSWTQYTKALAHESRRTVDMTTKLRHALEADQLELYYQPQVDLTTGRIVSAEALLRWNHPQAGFIPPDQFIPLAEQSQLIGPIGEWVLRQACRDLKVWREAGLPSTPVSINVSLIQFQLGSVPDKVRQALTDYGVAPKELTLEITESVFEQQGPALKQELRILSEMGVRLSLDDFGTGYSSLGHLSDYFFDEIKIDKSFVCQLDNGPYAQAIVKAVIVIAAAIGADIVAEGLELPSQIATVQQLGCTKGQGYYFSRPIPEPSWRQLLSNQNYLD